MKLPKAIIQDIGVTLMSGVFVVAMTPEQFITLRATLAEGVRNQEYLARVSKEIKAVNWKSTQKQYEEAKSVQKNLERAVAAFTKGVS